MILKEITPGQPAPAIDFHISKRLSLPFNTAIDRVTEELKKEGFGIITTIDLKETFRKKIKKEFRNYVILGACNPNYAYEVLQVEPRAGIFLPCNVVVQEHDDGTTEISIVNPEVVTQRTNPNLRSYGIELRETMESVLRRV